MGRTGKTLGWGGTHLETKAWKWEQPFSPFRMCGLRDWDRRKVLGSVMRNGTLSAWRGGAHKLCLWGHPGVSSDGKHWLSASCPSFKGCSTCCFFQEDILELRAPPAGWSTSGHSASGGAFYPPPPSPKVPLSPFPYSSCSLKHSPSLVNI